MSGGVKLKYLTTRLYGDATAADWADFISLDTVESWTGRRLEASAEGDRNFSGVACRPGDVLFGKLRPYLAKVHWVDRDSVCASEFIAMRPGPDADGRFLRYVLATADFVKLVDSMSYGTKMPRVDPSDFLDIKLEVPTRVQQSRIADYLDSETARIDTLIERKEGFIELLLEKRAALITHVVTKGLDPDVEMKDSGVEWIGSIPANWRVMTLRRFIDSIEQGWSPVAEDRVAAADEWAVTKLSAVSRGRFLHSEHKTLEPDCQGRPGLEVRADDLLLSRSNTPDRVGDVALVEEARPRLMICDLIYRLTVRNVDRRFLVCWLLSSAGRRQIMVDARGTSGSMVKISQSAIRSWYLPIPPLREQARIAASLDERTAAVDAIIETTLRSIDLLREYRTALISAAVTGQIEIPAAAAGEDVA